MIVARSDLAEMLRHWQAGDLSAGDIFDWAQDRYWPGTVEFDDWEADDSSVANEVLAALDQLPMNLVLAEDVPLYLEFLVTPRGEFAKGYEQFRAAIGRIDYQARRRVLSGDEFYGPYCR